MTFGQLIEYNTKNHLKNVVETFAQNWADL